MENQGFKEDQNEPQTSYYQLEVSSCPNDGLWPLGCCHMPIWLIALSIPGAFIKSHWRAQGQGSSLLWPLRGIQGISWKGEGSYRVWLPGLAQDTPVLTSPSLSLQLSLTEFTAGHPAGLSPHSGTLSRRHSLRAKDQAEGAQRQCSVPPPGKVTGDLPSTVTLEHPGHSLSLANLCF